MNIKDLYVNLDKNMEGLSKKSNNRNISFGNLSVSNENIRESFDAYRNEHLNEELSFVQGIESFDSYLSESSSLDLVPINDDRVISTLRNLFGKENESISTSIGCHPDFENLSGNNIDTGYVVTLFMDIIGSTKLGVNYSPKDVFFIKNNIIQCAIETIRAFGGHTHRIMGDAVMAFFRKKEYEDDSDLISNSSIDAINCATYIIEAIKNIIIPRIDGMNILKNASSLGVRIGIDLGLKKYVLWSNYGLPGINEITATSFFVDIASKLQHNASKNTIMLGDMLVSKLGLSTDDYLEIKEKENEKKPYVIQVVGNDKRRFSYKQYQLKHDKYFKTLPHGSNETNIEAYLYYSDNEDMYRRKEYHSGASIIKKNNHLECDVSIVMPNSGVGEFIFRVFNSGCEASKEKNKGDHESPVTAIYNYANSSYEVKGHKEYTLYKGLHELRIDFFIENKKIDTKSIWVFIS